MLVKPNLFYNTAQHTRYSQVETASTETQLVNCNSKNFSPK